MYNKNISPRERLAASNTQTYGSTGTHCLHAATEAVFPFHMLGIVRD